MAYTKKATETEKEVEVTTDDVKQVESSKQTTKTEQKKDRIFKDSDPILCISITAGELGMIGVKTGINYTWVGRGDEVEVEYQDLVGAIRSGKKHITEPYFIIKDDDFLDKFPKIREIYGSMYSINDLREVLALDTASMKATILSLPSGAQESIKNIASTMIQNGQIDSVSKIKALDELYNTNFMLMTELYEN